jgi:outer membrane protein OmpA-like peptidoglycan-associated protein
MWQHWRSKVNKQFGLSYLAGLFMLLAGCASSGVERDTTNTIDHAYYGSGAALSSLTSGSAAGAYQNSSQTSKGVVLGGGAGALAGGLTSGIGMVPGMAGGAIWGGALGAYIDSRTTLVDKLQNRGVKVVVLGDQIMLVMRSAYLFHGTTSNLLTDAYSTLNLVAKFIGDNPNMSVRVAGNVTMAGPEEVNRSVSRQQAEAVVKYLWRTGVNTRMLYAVGEGGKNPVVKDELYLVDTENYRIEITMEKVPV